MAQTNGFDRKSYGTIQDATSMPDFLDVQLVSCNEFMQADVPLDKREKKGLHQIFLDVFPISDVNENYSLEYVNYYLGQPRYTIEECRERNMTYAAPLRVTMRLISRGGESDKKVVKDIIEQDVYLGELPLITRWGTFIINGAERVVVSQLHRSPGVFFDEQIHPNGKLLYSARIIPYRGSWIEFSTDINDVMNVYLDSRRKLPASILMRALGYSSTEDIINLFYKTAKFSLKGKLSKAEESSFLAENAVNKETGEVIYQAGEPLTDDVVEQLKESGYKSITIIPKDEKREVYVMLNTLRKDPTNSREEALIKIYNVLRPGEPPTLE
ncbi:MAG: DNA-directed RNA polymerase subunit beta, partial [Candidatus Zixiibacteriota bacterium]